MAGPAATGGCDPSKFAFRLGKRCRPLVSAIYTRQYRACMRAGEGVDRPLLYRVCDREFQGRYGFRSHQEQTEKGSRPSPVDGGRGLRGISRHRRRRGRQPVAGFRRLAGGRSLTRRY